MNILDVRLKKQIWLTVFFSIICLFLMIPEGISQDTLRKKNPLKYNLSLSGAAFRGNVSKFDVISKIGTSHKDSVYEFSFLYRIAYGELKGEVNNKEHKGHVKLDYKPFSTFSPFLAIVGLSNEYKGIKYRFSTILGCKYKFHETEKSELSVSAAIQNDFESNRYKESTGNLVDSEASKPRISMRPKVKLRLAKLLYFEHYTFYQPYFKDFSDFHIISDSSLESKISDKFTIGIDYLFNYSSNPPSGEILREDHYLLATIKISI